jgi:hypothetical protein
VSISTFRHCTNKNYSLFIVQLFLCNISCSNSTDFSIASVISKISSGFGGNDAVIDPSSSFYQAERRKQSVY